MDLTSHLSIVLALSAAFLFALAAHVQHMGLDETNSRQASLIIVGTAAALHWLVASFTISPEYWLTTATLLFALTGLIRPTLTVPLWVEGVRRLGPTLNAGLSASGPIFGAAFAITLLGEKLNTQIAVGTLAVVAGILVTSIRPSSMASNWPLWAILLPLGAAAGRALAHSVTKIGYEEVASPVFVGLVSTTLSLIILTTQMLATGQRLTTTRTSTYWFLMSGLLSTGGVFALNVALQTGQVLSVSPIVSTSPVFALLLAILIFRKETVTWRTVATVLLVVSGVILVIVGSRTG
ncbi:MAG: EamA family transporter [Pseudomonadota bacterium]